VTPQLPLDFPAALHPRFERIAGQLSELTIDLPPAVADSAVRVALVSDFVLGVLLRFPQELVARLDDPAPLTREVLAPRLDLGALSESQVMAQLRRLRQIEMARIAWRDLAAWSDLDTTLAEVSMLADCLIAAAVEQAAQRLEPRFGRLRDAVGDELPLLVLGMGKLGGGELNFSSDVDLVFLYPDGSQNGDSADAPISEASVQAVEPETYYLRLSQLLIKFLDQVTEDGLV
jgi:glutamate-ammonia-ligase adenylyltransferase